jgi:outer membrane protein, multidrug efflux system
MQNPHLLTAILCGLSLTSCKVGPDYEVPTNDELQIPKEFVEVEDPAFSSGAADLTNWWVIFDDPILTKLIESASSDNRDLRIAVSRVKEARARTDVIRSQWAPQVGVSAGYELANDTFTNFDTLGRSTAGIGASWELDVFGRIARQVESAEAQYQAAEEDRRDVQVALYAEVARAYLSVRTIQGQLKAAENNIESQRETLRLTQIRLENGIATALDQAQAKQVLASSLAELPPLRISLSREMNTISILVGTHPQQMHTDLSEPQPIPMPPEDVTVDVPAQVLRQRPDVRASERRLAAQTAEVGVATADLYPSFSLEGNFGFDEPNGGNLFDSGNRGFAIGPAFRWDVYNGGRLRSQIDVQDARLEQSLLRYENTILSALEEVETSMTAFTEQRKRLTAILEVAEESRTTLRLATLLYKDGLANFQQVLDAQRQTLLSERQVAKARGLSSQNLVSLYRALGGGWDTSEVAEEEPLAPAGEESEPQPGQ